MKLKHNLKITRTFATLALALMFALSMYGFAYALL